MEIKEAVNQSIKDLENFQATVNKKTDLLSIDLDTKEIVATRNSSNNKNTTLLGLLGGIAFLSGIVVEKTEVKIPLMVAGCIGLGYATYQKFGKSENPSSTISNTNDWNGISQIIREKFTHLLQFKDDFRNLITQNRDKILDAIDQEVTDSGKKQVLNNIAHYREVPSISYSDYTILINNAINAKNKTDLDQVISTFKLDVKNATEKAIENQKNKYKEILKEM